MQSEDTWMELHVLHDHGWSIAALAREFGLDWRTAKRYATASAAPSYRPRRKPTELNAAQLAHVERRLAACPDLRVTVLLRELRDDYGYTASYTSLRRRVVGLRPVDTAEPELRFETGPGVQTQGDWTDWIEAVVASQGPIPEGTLTVHADRGSAMTSKPVAQLLADLRIGRTHSRPHVSNDDPYSEAGFKTLKYSPAFPRNFGGLADARAFVGPFIDRYNHAHRHSGIGYHTPASVHFGTAAIVREERARVLDAAYAAHPDRFVNKPPTPPDLPGPAWINQPKEVEGQSIT